jgi:hypothetical protein
MLRGCVVTLVACGCIALAGDCAAGDLMPGGGGAPAAEPVLTATTPSVASATARAETTPAPVARPRALSADRIEALARALVLLSAAGGGRPFPTIPQ